MTYVSTGTVIWGVTACGHCEALSYKPYHTFASDAAGVLVWFQLKVAGKFDGNKLGH
jgi:hypothetical protein